MSCYKFIEDKDTLRVFYKTLIEPFAKDNFHSFIIVPIARRKYWEPLSRSQIPISTKTISAEITEKKFVQTIERYQIKEGTYYDSLEQSIPSEAMAIYITINPMNELDGYLQMQHEIGKKIKHIINDERNIGENTRHLNIISSFKSSLHTSSFNIFKKLDVDTKDADKISELQSFFKDNKIELFFVIESRGGYHVVMKKEKIPHKAHHELYKFCQQNKEWITLEKNALVILPGTYQGGFLTKFVDW